MKSILLSIKPKWVAKILNGEKTIEVRKKFPKYYRGWVYIYCTKEKPRAIMTDKGCVVANTLAVGGNSQYKSGYSLSGEVIARFWCDKVEHFEYDTCSRDIRGYWLDNGQFFKNKGTCLSAVELLNYIKGKDGYAIHISKLEIFDEPKELWQFKTPKNYERYQKELEQSYTDDAEIMTRLYEGYANDDECANSVELTEMTEWTYGLTKAPQNYCYVESEELK